MLSNKSGELDAHLNSIKQSVQQMEKEVLWWGEADANDISGFLVTWLKFSQAFQKTVTFFKEQEKREKAKLDKAAKQKQKEGEKKTIEKFVNNLQTNRKTGRGQGVESQVVEELLQGVLASMDTASAVEKTLQAGKITSLDRKSTITSIKQENRQTRGLKDSEGGTKSSRKPRPLSQRNEKNLTLSSSKK